MQLLFSVAIFTGILSSAVASAIPKPNIDLAGLLAVKGITGSPLTKCDLTGVRLPEGSGDRRLAKPDAGLKLTRVVLGRGTQNYTCADFNESTIPKFVGAEAILYDASCLAVHQPTLLNQLPNSLVTFSPDLDLFKSSTATAKKLKAQDVIVGRHHFNPEGTTPIFDFRMKPGQDKIFTGTRDDSVPAPSSASKGTPGEEFGPVDWLRIKAIPDKTVGYTLGYRLHTAGGKAPATCKGLTKKVIEVQYATQYWFYNT